MHLVMLNISHRVYHRRGIYGMFVKVVENRRHHYISSKCVPYINEWYFMCYSKGKSGYCVAISSSIFFTVNCITWIQLILIRHTFDTYICWEQVCKSNNRMEIFTLYFHSNEQTNVCLHKHRPKSIKYPTHAYTHTYIHTHTANMLSHSNTINEKFQRDILLVDCFYWRAAHSCNMQ